MIVNSSELRGVGSLEQSEARRVDFVLKLIPPPALEAAACGPRTRGAGGSHAEGYVAHYERGALPALPRWRRDALTLR